jgi:hypothetical protein
MHQRFGEQRSGTGEWRKRATKSAQPLHQLDGHILWPREENQFPIMKRDRLVLDHDSSVF